MFDLVTYCNQPYFSRLEKTIKNWNDQKSVENIFIYTNEINKYDLDKYKNLNKVKFIKLFEDDSTCFGTNCSRKAESLKYFINNNKFENILLLDIDCLIMKDLNDLFNEDFNIFVTIYPEVKEKYRTNNISAGFVALKNCNQTKDFINQWVERQNNLRQAPCRDQKALSELITDLYKNHNDIYKIKLLDSNVWNSHPCSGGKGYIEEWLHRIKINKPYILHFASNSIDSQDIIDKALIAMDNIC